MAQDMGPFGEVSTFTTVHPCCQNRVTNIQLLADEIRGALVLPGEEFSINDRAGIRTLEEGYVRAGAIIGGRIQCCESVINIGGGTSQFATTFYNAVFFGFWLLRGRIPPAPQPLLPPVPLHQRGDHRVPEPRRCVSQRLGSCRVHPHGVHAHIDNRDVLREQRRQGVHIGARRQHHHPRDDAS